MKKIIKEKRQRKLVKLNVYFWTHDLPKSKEKTLVWNGGFVTLQADKGKGVPVIHQYFNAKSGIEENIQKLFTKANILVVDK